MESSRGHSYRRASQVSDQSNVAFNTCLDQSWAESSSIPSLPQSLTTQCYDSFSLGPIKLDSVTSIVDGVQFDYLFGVKPSEPVWLVDGELVTTALTRASLR